MAENTEEFKVYTCVDFEGYYPVGSAAVVVATSRIQARNMLNQRLKNMGLPGGVKVSHLTQLNVNEHQVIVLCDGNY